MMLKMTTKEFRQLANYIRKYYGIELRDEKKMLVEGRLQNVVQAKEMKSFSEYYQYVESDLTGVALDTLINKITTNHTFFLREPAHFKYFYDQVLPNIARMMKTGDLRVWCAACSSGQEAYTLAIIIQEFCKKNGVVWDKKLLATDISSHVLFKAAEGIYDKQEVESFSRTVIESYFNKIDANHYQVKDTLKKEVIYRRFNLMENKFPFKKKFHVIFCRNVMIYFNKEAKAQLIDKLYDMLEVGGYLFISHSEILDKEKTLFKYIGPSIYQKQNNNKINGILERGF